MLPSYQATAVAEFIISQGWTQAIVLYDVEIGGASAVQLFSNYNISFTFLEFTQDPADFVCHVIFLTYF